MAEGSGWLFLHQETEHQDSIVKAAFKRRIFQIKVAFITLTRHFEILCTNSIGFLRKIHHNAPPMSSIIYIHTRDQNTLKIQILQTGIFHATLCKGIAFL